jgi:hypothetical protein
MSRWYILSVFAALTLASPVLAASDRSTGAPDRAAKVSGPAAPAPKPVLTAKAPFSTVWNSTVLSTNSKAMGLQASRGANNHMRWTIAGAAIGAIVGAIADDPLRDAAIGAAVGLGGSYVMRR